MKKVSRERILKANQAGLKDRETDRWRSFYTPTLQVAYNLGQAGRDLSNAPEVRGYRYGPAPQSFISQNWRDDRSEHGLSLAALDGQEETWSAMFVWHRNVFYYSGLLVGRGADGEPVILCYEAEDYDLDGD